MKISKLTIANFRGVKSAILLLPQHGVLIGDNNTGKSTILEALDLAMGPDRTNRHPVVDEHDFYLGLYQEKDDFKPKIDIEVTLIDLDDEQRSHFSEFIEWWNIATNQIVGEGEIDQVDKQDILAALRVTFIGEYDEEEDDFKGTTLYTRTIKDDRPEKFAKRDKQICGFLYLRSIRTGSRALSLEHGSLLDIIIRIKEVRPLLWENIIKSLSDFKVAEDEALGISGILKSVEGAIKKFVPKEWGVAPHLKVSTLTRDHLRKVITAFIATGEGEHAAPFYRQGTGTINLLVLAMLSLIAEEKQNVIFAMEEPETAIPPYAQKRIIHQVRGLAKQTIFTSHSPYVLEEFSLDETVVLTKTNTSELQQSFISLPKSIKPKAYRQEFRIRFSEGLLSRRVLVCEGATEATLYPAAARRLAELDPNTYSSLEALGICTIDAGSDSKIADLGGLYKKLNKQVFATCDCQTQEDEQKIRLNVDYLFMHPEKGVEDLVLKNTKPAAISRFLNANELPPHLKIKHPVPIQNEALAMGDYLAHAKGNLGLADFIVQCNEEEIPDYIKNMCKELKVICE